LPTLYYLVGAAFGVVFLAVGSDHVVYPTKSFFRALAVLITLAGAWAIGICLASVLFTAKTVKLTDSGNLVFISPYRELVVLPGQLTSVHTGVPLDWNRLFPWKVRADLQGSIWLWPRFPDMDRMWAAFISNSPSADLDRLSMGWVRGSSYEDEIGG
jgi:hypothetical protein